MSEPSSNESSTPLVLEIAPSPRLRIALMVLHLVVPFLALAAWGGLAALGTTLASVLSYWWTHLHHLSATSPKFVRRLCLTDDGQWLLSRADGIYEARLGGRSLLSSRLCILVFRMRGLRRCAVIIDAAAVSPDAFRRLRAVLNRGSQGG